MKAKAKYTAAPRDVEKALRTPVFVKDFLPRPEELVLKDKTVRITIGLNQSSIAFFKKQAARLKVPYQTMIRSLLDHYVDYFKKTG